MPAAAEAEAGAGYNAVTLANNHMFDKGEAGFRDTMDVLKAAGIRYYGAGLNATEAAEPLVIETESFGENCGRVCTVGMYDPADGPNSTCRHQSWSATPRSLGMQVRVKE